MLVLLITPLVVMTYLGIIYFSPMNNQWLSDGSFSWDNTIEFVLLDQIGIELFTYYIISLLIIVYAHVLKISTIQLSIKGFLFYQLRFLPLFLIAFFIFNPITQTIRYWYHHFPEWDSSEYFAYYFYSSRLYLTYLLPVTLGGYALLNTNIYINYGKYLTQQQLEAVKTQKIEVMDDEGKTMVELSAITSFERIGRLYYAIGNTQKFRVNYNLNELEQILAGTSFYRISRSTIINLKHLKNYSFWENDKYIVRLTNGKEYTSSRDRIRHLENQMMMRTKE